MRKPRLYLVLFEHADFLYSLHEQGLKFTEIQDIFISDGKIITPYDVSYFARVANRVINSIGVKTTSGKVINESVSANLATPIPVKKKVDELQTKSANDRIKTAKTGKKHAIDIANKDDLI